MPTIIIPAHNEEKSISKCLASFVDFVDVGNLEVIVVCNGCKDLTASVVKNLSDKFICLETDVASKTYALNIGEGSATFFPRIYLDADVQIDYKVVIEMCNTLSTGCLATSLVPTMDLTKSSWAVRAFYSIWLSLPYCNSGMVGSGVYALSEKGRVRFDKFPDIIADDGYVRCLFKEGERRVTKGYYSQVKAPNNIFNLIKIKTRSRLGGYQLKDKFPELISNDVKDYQSVFKQFVYDYKLWPKVAVYISVNLIARIRANYQYYTNQILWERDDSSRY